MPRRLSVSGGMFVVNCHRIRDCDEQFVSLVPLLIKRKNVAVDHVPYELYLHGFWLKAILSRA